MIPLLSSPGVGLAQTVDTKLWGTNGPVYAIVPEGSTIYIGGNFTQVGPVTGGGAAVDASSGTARQPYPRVAGTVRAVVPDGSGGWYLGGAFTAVRGQPRNNVAHLDAGGQLTGWNPNANGEVAALAVSGGTVYVGGGFTSIGGQPRGRIAALDAATGAATDWNASADDSVKALAVSVGTVYAGGKFRNIGGQPRAFIAALDATGAATDWDPNPDYTVFALVVSGGTVYAGGAFGSIGGQYFKGIARLDPASGLALDWNDADGTVYALAVSGGTVYAGGAFGAIGGYLRNGIAAIDVATGVATSWNPNANLGTVYALAMSGGTVYAGGNFTSIGGQPRNQFAALDAASGAATAWNPNAFGGSPSTSVYAVAASGGTVYVGGNFASICGQKRNYIAALDGASGAATSWDPNAAGGSQQGESVAYGVYALAVNGSTVYAGGYFSGIGGQPRYKIAAIDASTGAATAWNPTACCTPFPGWDGGVFALGVSGGTVYAAGAFDHIGGQARNGIGALDPATGAATAWHPNPSISTVGHMVVSGGTVYAAGTFTAVSGQLRHGLAAIDAATGAVTAWDPDPQLSGAATSLVAAMAVSGSTVYLGGAFNTIGASFGRRTRNCIAALDATTGYATDWNPNVVDNPLSTPVYAIAVGGGTVYAGGSFTGIGGQARNHIAALDPVTGDATPWDPNANGPVHTLAVSGGTVYAGGAFTSIGGQPQSGIAAITEGYPLSVGDDTGMTDGSLAVVPNPTRAGMQIQYSVVRSGRVRLEVMDVSGRVEATLADRIQEPGRHVTTWDGVGRRGRLSPGLHFLRLVAPDGVMVRKLAVVQ